MGILNLKNPISGIIPKLQKIFRTSASTTITGVGSQSVPVAAPPAGPASPALPAERTTCTYRLVSITEWAMDNGCALIKLRDPKEIPIVQPPTLSAEGLAPSGPTLTANSNPAYIAELKNVTVYSKSGIIVAGDCAINEIATHPLYGHFVPCTHDQTVVKREGNSLEMSHDGYTNVGTLEHAIMLSGLGTEHFGHWVPEFLTKLQYLEQHPEFRNWPIIVDEQMPQSHFDYLSAIAGNEIIKLPPKASLNCRKLLVSSTPTFYPLELVPDFDVPQHELAPLFPDSLRFLQQRAQAKLQSANTFSKKLYFSRKNMNWRLLSNDDEVAAFLKAQGFEVIYPETMSLAEQATMWRNAEVIVAPNGSSTLNIIFSAPTLKLIVLTQPGLFNWAGYYGPVRELGYNMLFVAGDEQTASKHSNYTVPTARIGEALSSFDSLCRQPN